MPFPTPSEPFPTPPAEVEPTYQADHFVRYERPAAPHWWRYTLHLGLFLLTLATTTLAGAEWITGRFTFAPPGLSWAEIRLGLWYSVPFLGVLTVHEFGHYFMARRHGIRSSLPYFLPFFTGVFSTIGTFGAVIRIKDRIFSRRDYFDVGMAGPLAGFLVAVPVLMYGFTHLPPTPPALPGGLAAADEALTLAKPLLYQAMEHWLADPARLPHPMAVAQSPVLLAGALALFFTALNLLPIGQLDGGHIVYGLLGHRRANRLSVVLFLGFLFYAGLGLFSLRTAGSTWLYWGVPYGLYLVAVLWRVLPTWRRVLLLAGSLWLGQIALASAVPGLLGQPGWLLFGLLLGRGTGIYHVPAPDEQPLTTGRKVMGWLMLLIFVLCFTPSPFRFL